MFVRRECVARANMNSTCRDVSVEWHHWGLLQWNAQLYRSLFALNILNENDPFSILSSIIFTWLFYSFVNAAPPLRLDVNDDMMYLERVTHLYLRTNTAVVCAFVPLSTLYTVYSLQLHATVMFFCTSVLNCNRECENVRMKTFPAEKLEQIFFYCFNWLTVGLDSEHKLCLLFPFCRCLLQNIHSHIYSKWKFAMKWEMLQTITQCRSAYSDTRTVRCTWRCNVQVHVPVVNKKATRQRKKLCSFPKFARVPIGDVCFICKWDPF